MLWSIFQMQICSYKPLLTEIINSVDFKHHRCNSTALWCASLLNDWNSYSLLSNEHCKRIWCKLIIKSFQRLMQVFKVISLYRWKVKWLLLRSHGFWIFCLILISTYHDSKFEYLQTTWKIAWVSIHITWRPSN